MDKAKPAETRKPERIAKIMARAGLCSRRDAERWILDGRVAVDGKILESPALALGPEAKITVDGKPLAAPEVTRLWRYHKPRNLITSNRDPEGRPTVFEQLPEELPRVISVGRLDFNSEGLLLLTNNGELARHLELPATAWKRRYRVRVNGAVDQAALARLAQGITIDGIRFGEIEAEFERQQGANAWLRMALREGRNREVKRVLEHLGLQVTRLIRTSYGPFQLGDLGRGQVEPVPNRILADQLGEKAAGFGLMFGGPQAKPAKLELRGRGKARHANSRRKV